MGGEKYTGWATPTAKQGSPPHGRGKAVWKDVKRAERGITPAWAGKSIGLKFATQGNKDHPRMGGEKAHRCA